MKSEDENPETKEPEKSKEDEIMERILKYTQGCTFIMIAVITIILFYELNYKLSRANSIE